MERKRSTKTKKQPKGMQSAIIVAVAISLILSAVSFIRVSNFYNTYVEGSFVKDDTSYCIYVGLTDKNQNRQIVDYNVAKEIIKTICISQSAGYTIYEANGGYKENNIIHTENTIVLEMDRIDEETLYKVADEIKRRLSVHSVMIMKKEVEVFDY